MRKIIALILLLCCFAGAAVGETAAYFEEKQLPVHEAAEGYVPLERGVAVYYEDIAGSEATYDCGIKCTVLSDVTEEGERALEVRLTMLTDEFDPAHSARDMYACPAIYDYYTGARFPIRDSVGAVGRLKLLAGGDEITVKAKVTASERVSLDNYLVYTVDYLFEMPAGYDGLIVGGFPIFEFEGHNDFIEKKKTTVYNKPDMGPGGVFIRIK